MQISECYKFNVAPFNLFLNTISNNYVGTVESLALYKNVATNTIPKYIALLTILLICAGISNMPEAPRHQITGVTGNCQWLGPLLADSIIWCSKISVEPSNLSIKY
jgi:hypothetical protein